MLRCIQHDICDIYHKYFQSTLHMKTTQKSTDANALSSYIVLVL
jgi:hypothetical protein